jgi:hypothetical protein
MALKTGWMSVGELLITWRISAVAAWLFLRLHLALQRLRQTRLKVADP